MNNKISRRDFLKIINRVLAVLGLTGLLGPIIAYFYPKKLEEIPSTPVMVCPESEIAVGNSKTVAFGRYPALIINTEKGLKAYSAVCTHFACIVMWEPEINQITCPCHSGFFSVEDGSVISGPPPRPLTHLKTEIIDGNIFVKAGDEE